MLNVIKIKHTVNKYEAALISCVLMGFLTMEIKVVFVWLPASADIF